MKLKPLADRILVKRVDQDEKSKGGIIIPDAAQEKPQEAEIVAVGDGKQLENGQVRKLALKIGDRVLLTKYSGSDDVYG